MLDIKRQAILSRPAQANFFPLNIIILLLLLQSSLVHAFFDLHSAHPPLDSEPLYIALIAPLSGAYAEVGRSKKKAARLYLDKINAAGGVNGHPIEILVYDTNGRADVGLEQASKMVRNERVLMIMGHYFSSVAIHLGPIYEEAQIPALTYSASNKVIENNDWFFMINTGTKVIGQMLAHRLKHLSGQNSIYAVYESNDEYSQALYNSFAQSLTDLGGKVQKMWDLSNILDNQVFSSDIDNGELFQKLATEIKPFVDEETPIFIPMLSNKAAPLIIALRRQGITNTVICTDTTYLMIDIFKQTPEEQINPGYFSENILMSANILFDIAGKETQIFRQEYRKKYGIEPEPSSAFAYDSTKLAVSALQAINAEGLDIPAERKALRDYIASLDSPTKSLKGVTGLTYFGDEGYAMKPVMLSRVHKQSVISDFIQFSPVKNPKLLYDFSGALAEGKIIEMGNQHWYKTHVIYTNIEILNVEEINLVKGTALLDFHLWFGYKSPSLIDPTQIVFRNAVNPIILQKPIEEHRNERYNYMLYRVKGYFHMDFMPEYKNEYALNQYLVGIQFHHKNLPYNQLIYVKDIAGTHLLANSEKRQISAGLARFSNYWQIQKMTIYQDIISKPTLGNPLYMEYGNNVDFSRFNQTFLIKSKTFSLRRQMPENMAWWMMSLSLLGFIIINVFCYLHCRHVYLCKMYEILWLLQIPFLAVFILAVEAVILTTWPEIDMKDWQAVHRFFDVAWWLFPAYFVTHAIHNFIWMPLEERTGTPVPTLMRGMINFIVYMLAIFGILAFVFDMKITSLLATSGLFAMILGLAVKMNISNVFSGIALNLDKTFRIGDWIKVGDYPVGKVISSNWRAIQIETAQNYILSIPNTVAAESTVHNYHSPSDLCLVSHTIYVEFSQSPDTVKQLILEAMHSVTDVLTEPPPSVSFKIGKHTNEYIAIFRVQGYADTFQSRNQVNEAIYKNLSQGQIPIGQQQASLED